LDDVGLRYEFEAPDTQAGRDLVENIRLGNVDQSSFAFTVTKEGQRWEKNEEGTFIKRTITKVARLFDVSPVTYPAYPDASVALRSLSEFRQEAPATPESPTPSQEDHSLSYWQQRIGIIDKTAAQTTKN